MQPICAAVTAVLAPLLTTAAKFREVVLTGKSVLCGSVDDRGPSVRIIEPIVDDGIIRLAEYVGVITLISRETRLTCDSVFVAVPLPSLCWKVIAVSAASMAKAHHVYESGWLTCHKVGTAGCNPTRSLSPQSKPPVRNDKRRRIHPDRLHCLGKNLCSPWRCESLFVD